MRAEMGKDPSRAPSSQLNLPPGFRFYPTDEELVVHYLCKKAASEPFTIPIIAEIELYKFDPWDLPERALFGEKEWYFFSPRDRKYPNGSRPNRAAGTGYWKATGTDKPILTMAGSKKVGVKKALVFYRGKAPKGVKTNWIMHEYRLADSAARSAKKKGTLRLDDWVLCRIYKKCSAGVGAPKTANVKERSESSCLDSVLSPLPVSQNRMSPNLGSIHEDAYVDDKRMVSLHELYQNAQTYPTRNVADYNAYLQQMQSRMLQPAAAMEATQKHSGITNEQQGGASSADVSNAGSPSNVYSMSRHTSEGSVQEDDAAESTFNMLPTFSTEQMNAFPQNLYGLDAGLLPSPTSLLGGQGSFATLLDADYNNNSFFSSSDYNLQLRPFARGSHGSSWDAKMNYAT
ncbi:hypothetical protein L7F22_050940 [Adiantum nelumboides]|nr:hypothetical protein [Adiantum nelumboides]